MINYSYDLVSIFNRLIYDDENSKGNVIMVLEFNTLEHSVSFILSKVEYGMVGPTGGLLTVDALGQQAIATFPEQALVKTIKVALQVSLMIKDNK